MPFTQPLPPASRSSLLSSPRCTPAVALLVAPVVAEPSAAAKVGINTPRSEILPTPEGTAPFPFRPHLRFPSLFSAPDPKFNPPPPFLLLLFFPLRTCFTSPFSFSWIHSSSLSASVEQHLDEFLGIQKTTRGLKRIHSIVCLLSRSTESDFRYLPLSPNPIFSFVSCVDRYSFARPVLAADKT